MLLNIWNIRKDLRRIKIRNVKVFADIADYDSMVELCKNPIIEGFTTNPTLMKKAGITDYKDFALKVMSSLRELKPNGCLSLEVFADDVVEMNEQAMKISSWGKDIGYKVFIKIPVHNTTGDSMNDLIKRLGDKEISVNVTAVFTPRQVIDVLGAIVQNPKVSNILSVFCGRISDAGQDAEDLMEQYVDVRNNLNPQVEMLWASTREVFNYVQADRIGCDIITMTPDLIKKINGIGRHLRLVSLDTIKMFRDDAVSSGFNI